MDPNSTGSSSKYGNWDFPEGVTFPVDVRVIVKFFKVAKCDADNETRFLNTKVIKQEVSLEKEDLFSKACLLKAIERDGDVKNLAHEESITNPKLEVSIKRQDSGEIFTVTKMGLVVRTLAKLVERSDTILVEVKEQIVCFQPKSPTIKITINNVRMENEIAGGRKLDEKVIKSLNSALKELDKSFYDKDLKKIICGKCVSGIKLRKSGAVETLVNYFRENHFSICGKREGKRKAKEDDEVNASEKKKRKVEKMDDYWNALRKKGAEEADLKEREEVEDLFEDADLAVAGPSSSSSGVEVDAFFDADLECDDKEQMELPDELGKKEDTEDEVHNIESETEDEFFDCFDTFDIDLEPSFVLPYCVAQETDPACVVIDRLIREGKLSTESFFYRNLSEVAKHLDDPNQKWDSVICEALMSIRHLGGMAAMNHVIGPLRTGYGRKDGKHFNPVLNYGGPSHFVLAKYVPGIMPISGLSKHLLLSALKLLNLSEVKYSLPAVELFSVALQMDGTMVKAGLARDSTLGFAVGCKDPLTYQILEEKGFKLDGGFFKQNLVTEVDVCVLVSLDSNVALSLGYILQPTPGKSGPEIIAKYSEFVKTVSKCEACVKSKPAKLNTIPPETPCSSVCLVCWNQGEVCEPCGDAGRRTIYPQLEPCFQCLEKGEKCTKVLVQVVALDCFSGNRILIEKFQTDFQNGVKDPELYFTEPVGEIIHILKTIKSSFSNWFLLGLDGNIFSLAMVRTLRDDNLNKDVSAALRKVLQKGSVVNRDRQDTDCLVEFSSAVPTIQNVAEIDPVVVHQICPEKYKLEPTNKEGTLGPVKFLGAINIGQVAVITDGKDESRSVLNVLDLHSPVRVKSTMEVPFVTGFVATEAVIVMAVEGGLVFVEVVKGTIIPKIPTKKAELVMLCKQLKLSSGGTAKELRARLIKKLKPSLKTEHQEIKLCPNLAEKLKKSAKISLQAARKGIPETMLGVDNKEKKIFSVNISYTGGDVLATMTKTVDLPPNLLSVELTLATTEVMIVSSTTQVTLLDHMFQLLRIFSFEHSVISMCVNTGGKFRFLQDEDQVWEESLDNMMNGECNAVHIAGGGKGSSKDGSGRSSRLGGATVIASYQNSTLIGTSSGKIKVITDVATIADFLENTFDKGVKGFGLHKKDGERNAAADLDSCIGAHNSIGKYLENSVTNIKCSFLYQVPDKLNGPQHSVSAVTVSTVKLAATSFAQIKENLKHVSVDGDDMSMKVNPGSTTTKAVEHFHSLAHRKDTVQTVHEYIYSWSIIVREMVKSLCTWPFKMFSGYKSSYYLRPEECRIPLEDVPMIPKLSKMNTLSKEENNQAKEICKEHKALPQSSTRAFTLRFKAGTLPLQAYSIAEPEPMTVNENPDKDIDGDAVGDSDETNSDDGYVDELVEWDSSCSTDAEDDPDCVNNSGIFNHMNQSRVTRSGRRVVAAKHFMFEEDSDDSD